MRNAERFSAFILATLIAGGATSAPVSAHQTFVVRVAPADEYFGRLKLSILGIRNQLRDLALRLQYAPERTADVLGAASFVEDSLHDWERKYPADPWLAKSVFELQQLYARTQSVDGQARAKRTLHWLLGHYGATPFAARFRLQTSASVK